LLSLGAPPKLIVATQQASIDEVRHACIFFELAARSGVDALQPDRLSLEGALPRVTLTDLAIDTFVEGCVEETISALLLAEDARSEPDPDTSRLLLSIAADELRHSELAWQTLAWSLAKGGDAVRGRMVSLVDQLDPGRAGSEYGGDESHRNVRDSIIASAWSIAIGPAVRELLKPPARHQTLSS
jgi:hypothetical protein